MKVPKNKHPHFDRKPPKCPNLRYILHVGFKELPVLNAYIIKYLICLPQNYYYIVFVVL